MTRGGEEKKEDVIEEMFRARRQYNKPFVVLIICTDNSNSKPQRGRDKIWLQTYYDKQCILSILYCFVPQMKVAGSLCFTGVAG